MWQSVEILNVFNTLTLKQIFWKTKTFFKKLEQSFLAKSTNTENTHFLTKLSYQKLMLRQIKWLVQNGLTSNYFIILWKFCFGSRTSYKEIIWCTKDPNAHIRTFSKPWRFFSLWVSLRTENALLNQKGGEVNSQLERSLRRQKSVSDRQYKSLDPII